MKRFLLAVAAVALAASLLGHPGVTAGPPTWGLLAGGAAGLVAGLALLVRPQLTRTRALALSALALFTAWSGAGLLHTLDPFLSGVTLASYAAALAWAALLLQSERRSVAHLLVAAAAANCLYGLAWARGTPFKAQFTNPDCFSVLPLVGALVALGLLGRARGAESRYLVGAVLGLALASILTASRAGLLGLAAGLVAYGWLTGGRQRRPLALALLAGLSVAVVLFGTAASQKWLALARGSDSLSVSGRLTVLRYGLLTAAAAPGLGTGPGTFALAYQDRRPPERAGEYMNVAHNDYLQVLVEGGLPALGLWSAFLLGCLSAGWRDARYHRVAAGATAAGLGVAVYACGNFALPVLPTLLFWVGALVLALPLSGAPAPRPLAAALGVAVALAGAGALGVAIPLEKADRALARAATEGEDLQWERAVDALPVSPDPRVVRARAVVLERLGRFQDDPRFLATAAQELQGALTRSPKDIVTMVRLARVLQEQHRLEEAGRVLAEAVRQSRHDQRLRVEVARNLILQGRLGEASRELAAVPDLASPLVLGELLAQLPEGQASPLWEEWKSLPAPFRAATARRVAECLVQVEQRDRALEWLARAQAATPDDVGLALARIDLEPNTSERLLELTELLNRSELGADQRNEVLARWSSLALDAGQAQAVVARLEKVARPPVALRLALSQAYERLGRLQAAVQVLNDGLDDDLDGTVRLRLAEIHDRLGNEDSARAYREEAARLNLRVP